MYYVYLNDTDSFTYDTLEEAEDGMERLRLSCIEHRQKDGMDRTLELWAGPFDEGNFLAQVTIDEGATP